jgi:16S rRNA (cytidine(1402)-2'-O)-methyltransferase
VPGPCAAIAALSIAGLPTDRFCFEGFLPARGAARRKRLQSLKQEARTLVLYEAPHRVRDMLEDCAAVFGAERRAVVVREITKLHEATYRGSLRELTARAEVLIKGRKDISDAEIPQVHPDSRETLSTIFRERIEREWKLGEKLWTSNAEAWEARKLAVYAEERSNEIRYLHAFIKHLKARIPPTEIAEGTRKLLGNLF